MMLLLRPMRHSHLNLCGWWSGSISRMPFLPIWMMKSSPSLPKFCNRQYLKTPPSPLPSSSMTQTSNAHPLHQNSIGGNGATRLVSSPCICQHEVRYAPNPVANMYHKFMHIQPLNTASPPLFPFLRCLRFFFEKHKLTHCELAPRGKCSTPSRIFRTSKDLSKGIDGKVEEREGWQLGTMRQKTWEILTLSQ